MGAISKRQAPLFAKLFASVFAVVLCGSVARSQTDTVSTLIQKKKLIIATSAVGIAYTATMITLGSVWYNDSNRQPFHFFNDAAEWKQVDKIGHFYSAFQLGAQGSCILRSCNLGNHSSDLIGTLAGFLMISSVEIFDGYSAAYGSSISDLGANAAGSLFYLGQGLLWHEVRIQPKFSFHTTALAPVRPEVLGSGAEEILKDYNGQTYWLSLDVDKFMPFPRWLNIAIGYGAEDMIYARDIQNHAANHVPLRQYYLSVDLDPTAIKTKSRFLKTLIRVVNMIKLPGPSLEFSKNGIKVHPFYF